MKHDKLKIANIGMQAKGGAGLSSHKLHKQFLKDGNESRIFVAKETWNTEYTELIPTDRRYKQNWWSLGTIPTQEGVSNIISSGFSGKHEEFLEDIYHWADVIILRWV